MKGVNLVGADLSPLAPSTSPSGRRRQAIGTTYTDLQDAILWADVIWATKLGELRFELDEYIPVPIFPHETLKTLLERALVDWLYRMLAGSEKPM
jgi:hypothetical protein